MFAFVLLSDLVGYLLLLIALFRQLVVVQRVPDNFFRLTHDDVRPGRRRLGHFRLVITHATSMAATVTALNTGKES